MGRLICLLLSGFVIISIILPQISKVEVRADTVVSSGRISSDTTWTLMESPFWIERDIYVDEGATLTIEPGTEVRFNGSFSLFIEGNLQAVGTNLDMIIFTSNRSSPKLADWDSVHIRSTGYADLQNCSISYAHHGVYLNSTSNNNVVYNNISSNLYGIYLHNSSNNKISQNSMYQNDYYNIYATGSNGNELAFNKIVGKDYIPGSSCRYFTPDGIYLTLSRYNSIYQNNISKNWDGIYIYNCSNNNITDNDIHSNENYGIYLTFSTNTNVSGNNIWHCDGYRIYVYGRNTTHYNHTISTSNKVDGEPANYLFQQDDLEIVFLNTSYLMIAWSDNVTIRKCNFSDGDGLVLVNVNNSEVIDCTFSNNYYPLYMKRCSMVNITDNSIFDNYDGLYVTDSTYIFVEDNEMNDDIFRLSVSHNCNIVRNKVTRATLHVTSSDHNTIMENTISASGHDGLRLWSSENNNVTHNSIFSCEGTGFEIYSSFSNNIYHNYVFDNKEGIEFRFSSHNVLWENQMWDNSYRNLLISGEEVEEYNNTISSSNTVNFKPVFYYFNLTDTVLELPTSGHVTLAYCHNVSLINSEIINGDRLSIISTDNSTIRNCIVSNNSKGIDISDSNNNIFEENLIESNRGDGISLFQCYYNYFYKNEISGNNRGIDLFNSIYNNIFLNNIFGNEYGVYLFGDSSDNYFIYNNFIDNVNQAEPNDEKNHWDALSLGNHWSDYSFGDDDGDGIGDEPYYIGPKNQDNHPVMDPINRESDIFPIIILSCPDNNSAIRANDSIQISILNPYDVWVYYTLDEGVGQGLESPYNIITANWEDGRKTITVWVEDTQGTRKTASFNITIDSSPPEIMLISPENNSVIAPGSVIDFDISDPFLDGARYSINNATYTIFSAPFDIDTSSWANGSYLIEIYTYDFNGNTNISMYNFTINTTQQEPVVEEPPRFDDDEYWWLPILVVTVIILLIITFFLFMQRKSTGGPGKSGHFDNTERSPEDQLPDTERKHQP